MVIVLGVETCVCEREGGGGGPKFCIEHASFRLSSYSFTIYGRSQI